MMVGFRVYGGSWAHSCSHERKNNSSKFEAEDDSLLHVEEYPRIGNKSS
jgi:hypothetical protein